MKSMLSATMMGLGIGIGVFLMWQQRTPDVPQLGLPAVPIVENAQAFILPVVEANYLPIRDFSVSEPELGARAAILVDAASGKTLYAKNADQQLPIASLAKLMSAMVILDHLPMDEVYRVSAEDLNVDGSGGDFREGERFRGSELLKIMLIKSSNDAVSVFATAAAAEGFDLVQLMNEKARALGMRDTRFADPAGLSDRETYSTAGDVALMLAAAGFYPALKEITTMEQADVWSLEGRAYHVINTNQLLATLKNIALGKTGNTTGALGTLAIAVNVNRRGDALVGVVLGSEQRFNDMSRLITWGKQAHTWGTP